MPSVNISGRESFAATEHGWTERAINALKIMLSDTQSKIYISYLTLVGFLAVFGPFIAPYPYDKTIQGPGGQPLINHPPSLAHPLGTNSFGYDVLSRLIIGAQPTVTAGFLGGILIITIGMSVGLISGYVGGKTETVLMRITDVAYGVPLLPFAMVIIAFIGIGFYKSILVIGLVLWRGSARVIRSQVLQIKERPFILAAKTTGVSTPSLILKHILPNVAPMAILFFAQSTGQTIIIQAGLAFLGLTSPFVPSWGIMIQNAYNAGNVAELWWWSLPPGIMIALTVLSLFMVGRRYEEVIGGEQVDEAMLG